jgi:predicted DNA binding protein
MPDVDTLTPEQIKIVRAAGDLLMQDMEQMQADRVSDLAIRLGVSERTIEEHLF